ncbi:integrase arm-type DNA-binding domain-containing protein [Microvirga sp. KLBC 81]|uniref:integrase arm-type DNA-binding domain-containing protein n=1 Tax=Microvirga sp. KLBC 81 TaxID=1862707 RepID=UPI001403E103
MAQSATFYLRLRTTTVTIGTIDDTTLEDARSRAEMARFYAKSGHDPKLLPAHLRSAGRTVGRCRCCFGYCD